MLGEISVGRSVVIGANVVVMPDVHIGDFALVAAGSVVTSGTRIGRGERWAGIPAKKVGEARVAAASDPQEPSLLR